MNILIRKIVPPLLLLLGILSLEFMFSYFKSTEFQSYITFYKTISEPLVIIFVTWLIINLVSYSKYILLKKQNLQAGDNLKARKVLTQLTLLQKVINFIVILIGLSLILISFDGIRRLGVSLLASAGIAGIIIGFAAQRLLSTIIAGLQIAFAQPIRIDDVVIVEDEWGWIEEINLTFVVIRIWDKRRLVVPTTYFIEKPFQNWTRNESDILGTVFIYTDYTVPIDSIREELKHIVEEDKHWDGKVNVLQVTNATEKTIELRVLVSAKSSPEAWELRVNVREKLLMFLQKNHPEHLPKTRIKLDK
jgi:small-conductance mechanosensitive channel